MKKKYIQPTVKMHSVSTSRIMAGSVNVDVNNTPYEGGDDGIGAKDDLDFGW